MQSSPDFGIVLLPVIPMRAEPSDRSEMTSQLLFGELVIINESKDKWFNITANSDHYAGWVDKKQVSLITEEQFGHLKGSTETIVSDLHATLEESSGLRISVPAGSILPGWDNGSISFLGRNYTVHGNTAPFHYKGIGHFLDTARLFLGCPYLWGGKTIYGIDCSGFTQVVARINGIALPRDAHEQAGTGNVINLLSEAMPGDLAFFDNEEGKIIHVGIILEDSQIIHASGSVRIDQLDHQGIYDSTVRKYSHSLRLIHRIIPPAV